MFIVVVELPVVKEGKESQLREWFSWSNRQFEGFPGFIRRRLLSSTVGANYVIIIEYENRGAFSRVQEAAFHPEAAGRLKPLLEGDPVPRFYEVIEG